MENGREPQDHAIFHCDSFDDENVQHYHSGRSSARLHLFSFEFNAWQRRRFHGLRERARARKDRRQATLKRYENRQMAVALDGRTRSELRYVLSAHCTREYHDLRSE
jgi:hypothetical protein